MATMPPAEQPAAQPRSVCAVVTRAYDPVEPTEKVIRDPAGLRDGVQRALASEAAWIWLLDGSAAPRPGSLRALLDGAERAPGSARPDVLTGVVLDVGGR